MKKVTLTFSISKYQNQEILFVGLKRNLSVATLLVKTQKYICTQTKWQFFTGNISNKNNEKFYRKRLREF